MGTRLGRGLGAAVVLLASTSLGRAEEIIALQKGAPLVGEILAVEGDAFRLRTGDAILTVEFWRVTPDALYRLLRARTTLDAAPARLTLATTLQRFFCFDGARAELRAAKALDPTLRNDVAIRLTDVDDAEAAWLLQTGREALIAEQFHLAVERLEAAATRFAGSPAAETARALLPAAREGAAKQPKPGGDQPPAPTKTDARVAKAIEVLASRIDAALESATTDLKSGHRHEAKGHASQAADAYESAAAHDREAQDWAQRVLQAGPHAPESARGMAQDRLAKAQKHLVLVYRALASHYMVQKSFQQARSSILQALEIDPENADALQLKAKIESEMLRAVDKKDDGTPGKVVKGKQ